MDRLSTKVVCNFYLYGVLHATRYGEFHATDLGELAHTAEAGVARVGAFGAVEVVTDLVSVIGTKRDGTTTGLFYFEHRTEELVSVEVALEGPFLVEVALLGLADGTQVHEVDAIGLKDVEHIALCAVGVLEFGTHILNIGNHRQVAATRETRIGFATATATASGWRLKLNSKCRTIERHIIRTRRECQSTGGASGTRQCYCYACGRYRCGTPTIVRGPTVVMHTETNT